MNKSSNIQRTYNGPDAKMLGFCSTILSVFEANIADFTAFDADLNPAYAASFANIINEARGQSPDSNVVAIISQHTANLKAAMTGARNAFQLQKFFVNKAFAQNPAIWNEFGFNTYLSCSKNPEKLFQFIIELHETSVKYETELAAVGFGVAQLAALAAVRDELQTSITSQQLNIGRRGTSTNQRIELLNTAKQMCRTICSAAKIVYASNYGMYQFFLSPQRRNKQTVIAEEGEGINT